MDVSGRCASTRHTSALCRLELGSEEGGSENNCEQCAESNRVVDADGFCVDCNDFLCNSCLNQHKILRGTKRHSLLEGSDMPCRRPLTSGENQCPKHPSKAIELYCQSDNTLGCVLCFTVGHRSCENFGLISDLSKDVESSPEMKAILIAAAKKKMMVDLYRKLIEKYRSVNEECFDKSLEDFHSFRSEMMAMIDKLGESVTEDANEFKKRNKDKLDSVSDDVTSIAQEVDDLMSDIELNQKAKKMDQLFIAVKRNMKKITDATQKLDRLRARLHIQKFGFKGDPSIRQGIENKPVLGTVKLASDDVICTKTINTYTPVDEREGGVCAIEEISDSLVVVTDYNNQSLKQIDVVKNAVVTGRVLSSQPRDVTKIPHARLAVALPDIHQIQYFLADSHLTPCGHISVDGQCMAVRYIGDKLIISCKGPGKVLIVDLEGKTLASFMSDAASNRLISVPRYVCLSFDHGSFYISDWKEEAITCLNTDGSVQWVYRDKDLKYPQGMATSDDGCLFVCSRYSHSIHVVSPAGVRLRVIPVERFKAEYPAGICFRRDQSGMYVTSWSADPTICNFIRQLSIQ